MKLVQLCSAAETDFTEALRRIAAGAEQFPAADDGHRYLQLRRFPFLIIFRVIRDGITVIAVAHTSRSPDFWRGR